MQTAVLFALAENILLPLNASLQPVSPRVPIPTNTASHPSIQYPLHPKQRRQKREEEDNLSPVLIRRTQISSPSSSKNEGTRYPNTDTYTHLLLTNFSLASAASIFNFRFRPHFWSMWSKGGGFNSKN